MRDQLSDSLDDMTISELFNHLERLGVNCSELRKVRNRMDQDKLRKSLYLLLENHMKIRGYRDAFNKAE